MATIEQTVCNGAERQSAVPAAASGCGCSGSPTSDVMPSVTNEGYTPDGEIPSWITGFHETPRKPVPVIATRLTSSDRWGAVRMRWGIGRMGYAVRPGLYAVGSPTPDDEVLVTANYKLTLDHLRSTLDGRSVWVLVLDTAGINVWCAAGKGTFGTAELVRRIQAVGLAGIVRHRRVILPQLGAPGVAAHEVRRLSGFQVIYGPVRARDIGAFLDAGKQATPEMRRVTFPLRDRVILIPVELVAALRYAAIIAVVLSIVSGFGRDGFVPGRMITEGIPLAVLAFLLAVASSSITPILLPWLPGRAFSLKGALAGIVLLPLAFLIPGAGLSGAGEFSLLSGWGFLTIAITSFLGMNFTGASTYTSLSGVMKEMRRALPFQIGGAVVGIALWCTGRFLV